MAAKTWVENGCVVGALEGVGQISVPLTEVLTLAGIELEPDDYDEIVTMSGTTIDEAIDSLGYDPDPYMREAYAGESGAIEIGRSKQRKARRVKRRKKIKKVLKKAGRVVKKIAKSKIVKGLAKMVATVTPPPFSLAIKAAQGAAKFARSLKKKNPKALKLKKAVQLAASGRITSKALTAQAKKLGVSAKIATDAALIKRVALDAKRNPKARAALRLAKDTVSPNPLNQQLALAAAAQAQAGPNARAFIVQAPGGKSYRTLVQAS